MYVKRQSNYLCDPVIANSTWISTHITPNVTSRVLLNKNVWDVVEAAGESGPQKLRIDRI
jgi:hypothetical protein